MPAPYKAWRAHRDKIQRPQQQRLERMPVFMRCYLPRALAARVLMRADEYEHAKRHAAKPTHIFRRGVDIVFRKHGAAIKAALLIAQQQHCNKPQQALHRAPCALYEYIGYAFEFHILPFLVLCRAGEQHRRAAYGIYRRMRIPPLAMLRLTELYHALGYRYKCGNHAQQPHYYHHCHAVVMR